MDQANCTTVRFATADLPEKDRVAIWREQYGRLAMKLEIEPINDASFDCAVVAHSLPGMQLLSAAMSPVSITRTRELAADGNDNLALIINRTGTISGCARGRDVPLCEGDAILLNSSDVSTFQRPSHGGSLSLLLPRSVLSSIVVDVEDVVMQLIPRDTGALKLLAGYATSLLGEIGVATPEFRRTTVNHLHDLIALSLGATHDAAGIARGRGLPAARLRMAKAFIVDNSNRRDLSVGTAAAHLGLTPRNLQRLFESEGTTFSEFLLTQRLARAHRMLTEPRLAQNAVGAIAYDAGFGDLSYFNRSFKRRYGATPRDVRNVVERLEQVSQS